MLLKNLPFVESPETENAHTVSTPLAALATAKETDSRFCVGLSYCDGSAVQIPWLRNVSRKVVFVDGMLQFVVVLDNVGDEGIARGRIGREMGNLIVRSLTNLGGAGYILSRF